MEKKRIYFIVQSALSFLVLFCCIHAYADIFDDTMKREEEVLKNIMNAKAGALSQGIELIIEPAKETYSMNEVIELKCTLKNDSNESRYYWSGEIFGIYNILIWYQHNVSWRFLYIPHELFEIMRNKPAELKAKEFMTATIKLEPEDIQQIYFDLQNPNVNLKASSIFICVTNDGMRPKQDLSSDPNEKFSRIYPSQERILSKSRWVRVEIVK